MLANRAAALPLQTAPRVSPIQVVTFNPLDDDEHWENVANAANSTLPPLRAELRRQ